MSCHVAAESTGINPLIIFLMVPPRIKKFSLHQVIQGNERLFFQKGLWRNPRLFQDCPKCTFWHISRMIRDGGTAICLFIIPDLVAFCCLSIKFKSVRLEPFDNPAVAKPSQAPHSTGRPLEKNPLSLLQVANSNLLVFQLAPLKVFLPHRGQCPWFRLRSAPVRLIRTHHRRLPDRHLLVIFLYE